MADGLGTEEAEPRPRDVALVTGAAGGLGRSCCSELCRRDMHVVATDLDAQGAAALADELGAKGGAIASAQLDVVSRSAVEALVADIVDDHGGLSVVVNLAGAMRNGLLAKLEDADFELTMATHVKGSLNTMRAAVPHMRTRGYGRIVNMSSIAARGTVAGASYGAAKGALEAMSRSAAMELARYGVTVNCVAPGLIEAGMFLTVPRDYHDESVARIPMQRAGRPEEVAACIGFLASPAASYVTGQTLTICGGVSLGF
jgi:3-oxoacyl-[acyl-carrier protein] reductase